MWIPKGAVPITSGYMPEGAVPVAKTSASSKPTTNTSSGNPFAGLLNLIMQPKKHVVPTPIQSPMPEPLPTSAVAKMFGDQQPIVKNLPKKPVQNTQGQMGTTSDKNYQGLQDRIKGIGQLTKQIAVEAPARAAGGFTLSATGQKQYDPNAPMNPVASNLSKFVFGNEPVKNIQGQGEDYSKLTESLGLNKDVAAKAGLPLAVGLGAMDVLPGGGGVEKKLVKEGAQAISKTKAVATTADYLKELEGAQKAAKGATSIKEKVAQFFGDLKKGWVDSQAPIEDTLTSAEKTGQFKVRPEGDIRLQHDRVLRAKSLATQFAKDNGFADVTENAPDLPTLDQYMIAKHAARMEELGKTTGRDAAKDAQLIHDLAPTYEPFAQKTSAYSRKLLDYSVESGLISKESSQALKERYPDYVPLERIFSDLEKSSQPAVSGGKAAASLAKQTVVQKFEGSEREIASPLESLMKRTQTAFEQGERNKAAQMLASYKDLPGFEGLITPLRTAENVKQRISLYSDMKELKPIRTSLERTLQSSGRQARQLQTEVNRLETKGMSTALKATSEPKATPFVPAIVEAKNAEGAVSRIDVPMKTTATGNQSTKKFIEDLITEPNKDIQALKRQVATRENKLAPLLDHIQLLRDSFEGVKAQRASLFDEAKALRDAESRGKSTFNALNGGIKETYETTKEIANAAKSLNKEQMNIVTKIISFPTRLIQLTATGLNTPFAARNLAKDQVTGAINSDKTLSKSMINPMNFVHAFFAATLHNDLYEEAVRNAALSKTFDISRSEPDLTLKMFRANRSLPSKIKYVATSPGQWVRTLEDIVGRSEEVTRLAQYRGSRNAHLAAGRTPKDAKMLGAKTAREATANFARGGDQARMVNLVVPFFNAGIQGARSFLRAAKERPVQTATIATIDLFMPMAAVTLWNTTDPERQKVYDDIPDYEKQNNLIFIPPNPTQDENGKWNVIKTPMPPGMANLASIVRNSIEHVTENNPIEALDILTNLIGATTSFDVSSGQKILSSFTPQIVKPFVESAFNKNMYTGRDIVPHAMKDLPPEDQAKPNESPLSTAIGHVLNVSPLIVDNFIRTTIGGVGSQFLGEDAVKQIIGSFSKASGGALDGKEYQVLQEYRQQQALTTVAEKEQATKAVAFLTDPNRDMKEKQQLISALKQPENKAIYDRIKRIARDQSSDVTSLDKAIRGLSTKQQAAYLLSKLNDAAPEEQQALLEQYKAKGLLTKSVIAEMKKQKVNPITPVKPNGSAGYMPEGAVPYMPEGAVPIN